MPGVPVINCPDSVCCDYVEAVKCSGQSGTTPPLYVRLDAFPEGVTVWNFRYAWPPEAGGGYRTYCYTADATATVVTPAHDAHVISPANKNTAAFGQDTDCTACKDKLPDDPESGGGGGGGGGGVPEDGGSPPGTMPRYAPATLCGGSGDCPDDLIVIDSGEPTDAGNGVVYFRYRGCCYSIDLSTADWQVWDEDVDGPIADAFPHRISLTGGYNFNTCENCQTVIPLMVCPFQVVDNIPRLYTNPGNHGDDAKVFRYQGICYYFDPFAAAETSDPGQQIISRVPDEFETCEDCTKGVLADYCAENPYPEQGRPPSADYPKGLAPADRLWCPATWLPGATIFFRHKGLCYSLDPAKPLEGKPPDAILTSGLDEYVSCAACICGDREADTVGVRATVCQGQTDAPFAPPLYIVQTEAWPDSEATFRYRNICYHIFPNTPATPIQTGADTLKQAANFYNGGCLDCLNDRSDDPSDPPEPPPNWPPNPPGDPPPPIGWPPPNWPPGWPPPWPPDGGGGRPPPGTPGGDPPPPTDPGDPTTWRCVKTRSCADNSEGPPIPKRLGLAGKVISFCNNEDCSDWDCYRVTTEGVENCEAFAFTQIYFTCAHCENDKKFARLKDCETGNSTNKYVRWLDYISGGGSAKKVYKLGDNKCYEVITPPVIGLPVGGVVVSGSRLPNCADPACPCVMDSHAALGCGACGAGEPEDTPETVDITVVGADALSGKSWEAFDGDSDGKIKVWKACGNLNGFGASGLTQNPANPCEWTADVAAGGLTIKRILCDVGDVDGFGIPTCDPCTGGADIVTGYTVSAQRSAGVWTVIIVAHCSDVEIGDVEIYRGGGFADNCCGRANHTNSTQDNVGWGGSWGGGGTVTPRGPAGGGGAAAAPAAPEMLLLL